MKPFNDPFTTRPDTSVAPSRRTFLTRALGAGALLHVANASAQSMASATAAATFSEARMHRTAPPHWQPDPKRIRDVVARAVAEQRLVGAVVQVTHRGQPVLFDATGLAHRKADRPMRTDTLFRLASISKPIVTTAAMVLVQQGQLRLDDPVVRWLPDFRPALPDGHRPEITLRQLLTHTSGLSYRFLESRANGPLARAGVSDGLDDAKMTLAENLKRLASAPLLFAPGTAWNYSLGIDVIGGVIERATGQALGDVVRALVTAPLGMNDTGFFTTDAARLATPYVNGPAGEVPHRLREGEVASSIPGLTGMRYAPSRALDRDAFPSGGGGMVGSAGDLTRLFEALRRGGAPLLSSTTVDEMGRNQIGRLGPPDAPGTGFGLGFSVLVDPVPTHSPESIGTWRWGGAYGHSWFVDGACELTVVALTNTLYEGMSGAFVNQLRDAVYA